MQKFIITTRNSMGDCETCGFYQCVSISVEGEHYDKSYGYDDHLGGGDSPERAYAELALHLGVEVIFDNYNYNQDGYGCDRKLIISKISDGERYVWKKEVIENGLIVETKEVLSEGIDLIGVFLEEIKKRAEIIEIEEDEDYSFDDQDNYFSEEDND